MIEGNQELQSVYQVSQGLRDLVVPLEGTDCLANLEARETGELMVDLETRFVFILYLWFVESHKD